jgi:outer membrane protein insertion porin family
MILKIALISCGVLAYVAQPAVAQDFGTRNKNTLTFSAAYSEQYKATLGLDLAVRAKKPGGTNLNLYAARHDKGHRITLRFDRGAENLVLKGGAKLFYGVTVNDDDWQGSAYNTRRLDAFVGARWDLGNHGSTLSLQYTLGKSRVSDVAATTSSLVAAEAGDLIQSSLRVTYKTPSKPVREGGLWRYGFKTSADLYGLGGRTKYANVSLNAHLSRGFASGYTLSGRTTAGVLAGIDGYGPRITDRAFLASSMPRGYAFAGIGPSDRSNGNRTGLGGLNYVTASLELDKDLIALDKSTINGYFFADAGSVWGLDNTAIIGGAVDDGLHIRGSIGVGLGWKSGFGHFSISYAKPIGDRASDVTQPLQLGFRTIF